MEYIHININHLETSEVVIQQILPTSDMIFVVEVTNEANRTYFHGRSWKEMIERYGMEPGLSYISTWMAYTGRPSSTTNSGTTPPHLVVSSTTHEIPTGSLFITHPWSRSRKSDLVTWLLCSMYIMTWSLAC
jgi:hypothetical protein